MNAPRSFLFGYDRDLPLELEVRREQAGGVKAISYLSSGPVRVPALLSLPRSPNGAAILVQHGGGESKDVPLIRVLLKRWSAAGFACLAIDAPGHGERSVTARNPRRGFHEYLRSRTQNVIDLRRGIDLLLAETGVDASRIGYWGVSMGGGVGVMLMAADLRVRAACLCLAGARSRRSWPEADPAAQEFAAANLDPLALAPLIAGREVLMLNGESDQAVPHADARRLLEALPGPKEQRWFKAGHHVTPAMLRASREFFERVLV